MLSSSVEIIWFKIEHGMDFENSKLASTFNFRNYIEFSVHVYSYFD